MRAEPAIDRPTEVTLSEHASTTLLAGCGIPVARAALARDVEEAVRVADGLGYPVVVKLCGATIVHKTERSLVRVGLADAAAVRRAATALLALARPADGDVGLLVAEHVAGRRELIAGLVRDPQFGPCVMLGLGGIFAEALGAVVFAAAPLTSTEAGAMLADLRARLPLLGPFRGEPAVCTGAVGAVLVALGRLGDERADVRSVDVNPLIVRDGKPVAADALVVLEPGTTSPPPTARAPEPAETILERFRPLFHPRGVIVAGASSHPGKFGFVAFHNLLRFGFRGALYPVNRDGAPILGHETLRDVSEVPRGNADLVFVCTPSAVNAALLRACAEVGVRAAFVASGGYREAGEEGAARER